MSLGTGSLEKIVKVGDERFTCGTNNVSPNNIHLWCYFIKNDSRFGARIPFLRQNLLTDRDLKPLFPGYASCSNKLTCECVFPFVTTRSLTKSTFTASIFRLKQHSKVVFPAFFLRLVPRTYPTLKMADNCKALPHQPHFSPVSLFPRSTPPGHFCSWVLPSWYFSHLERDRLINSSSKNKNGKLIATFNC